MKPKAEWGRWVRGCQGAFPFKNFEKKKKDAKLAHLRAKDCKFNKITNTYVSIEGTFFENLKYFFSFLSLLTSKSN